MEKEITFTNNYTGEEVTTTLPNSSKYDFLLERNKNHMNNIALSFGNRKITYEEMHERILEYTRALYKKGIRQGDIIAVCMLNTPESVYLLYALERIGAIVVGLSPLNNEYKMARDLELVKPKMLITVDALYGLSKNSIEPLNISPVLYSPIESLSNPFIKAVYNMKQRKEGNVLKDRDQNLKYIVKDGKNAEAKIAPYESNKINDILFTGGSSGVHKGVDLSSNALNCVVKALDYVLILEPGMVHLGNVPFGHMCFGRLVLHYALCKNLEYALTLEALPNKFYDEIVRTKANGAMGGPIHWENVDINKVKEGSLTNLIQAISGGEMFKEQKRKEAEAAIKKGGSPAAGIGDGLGLTEMWAPTHINMAGKNTPGTIGYAIPFVESKVIDPSIENTDHSMPSVLNEVPTGESGLLFVHGPGMMLEYHNNPTETDKVFFKDENGKTWYNTGDLVKRTGINNQEFAFVGRKKRNFVCGVDNVYPEQIEKLLLQFPEIREVVITKVPDEKYQYLPSYHISLNEAVDTVNLKNKIDVLIESTLGASCLPGYIEFTTNPLPRTDNGKLNAPFLEEQDMKKFNNNEPLKLVRKEY